MTSIEDLWRDILTIYYNRWMRNKILRKYDEQYAVGRLTVSTYRILARFAGLNEAKPYSGQIKPYNFITVGVSHMLTTKGKPIIPMHPYIDKKSKEFGHIAQLPFIDYKSGHEYANKLDEGQFWTSMYWKPLRQVVEDYMDHPETKFTTDKAATGKLPRRHVVIKDDSIRYIGKETNGLDEAQVVGVDEDNYTEYTNWGKIPWPDIISGTTPDLAAKVGLSRRNLSYLKRAVKQGAPLRMKPVTKNKLLRVYRRRI